MNCTVLWDRNFNVTVVWKKENIDLKPDGEKFVLDENFGLTINNLSFEDAGRTSICFFVKVNNVSFKLTVICIALCFWMIVRKLV